MSAWVNEGPTPSWKKIGKKKNPTMPECEEFLVFVMLLVYLSQRTLSLKAWIQVLPVTLELYGCGPSAWRRF